MGSRPNADVNSCLRWLAPFLETMLPETTANNNRNEKKTCSDYDLCHRDNVRITIVAARTPPAPRVVE